jgi:hypothetical protein
VIPPDQIAAIKPRGREMLDAVRTSAEPVELTFPQLNQIERRPANAELSYDPAPATE